MTLQIGDFTAKVFQLDNKKKRIPLFRKDGSFLEGVLTFKEPKRLEL